MTKMKVFFWIVLFCLLGLVIYQNRSFFLADQSLGIHLGVADYQTPRLPIALYMVGMFLLGWLIAYLSGAADRFHSGKQIKKLQQTIQSQQGAIDAMKADVAVLKAGPAKEPESEEPAIERAEVPASQAEPDADPAS